jgi:phosphate acetyltransferase
MGKSLYISTTEAGSGKALVALGLIQQLLRRTATVRFFRPVIRFEPDEDIDLILRSFDLPQSVRQSFGLHTAEMNDLIAANRINEGLERIITTYRALQEGEHFVLCEGSDYLGEGSAFEFNLNQEIARNLGCPILILGNAERRDAEDALRPVRLAAETYRRHGCRIVGIVLNKADPARAEALRQALEGEFGGSACDWVLSVIPFDRRLSSPRILDIAHHLQAEVLYGHDALERLALHQIVAAMQMQHALDWLREGSLVITPGDRGDVIMGMLQAHQSRNYPSLSGILLSGMKPEPAIDRLIEGLPEPLPILSVPTDTLTTVAQLGQIPVTLKPDDHEKIGLCVQTFERHGDVERLLRAVDLAPPPEPTPRMFNHNLTLRARRSLQRIVLPESLEPRILRAAALVQAQQLASLILLGDRAEIERVRRQQGIDLDLDALAVVSPQDSDRLETYIGTFVQLRRHKGATPDIARDHLLDPTTFATMMVVCGDADGMVSGATHTTQQTIRPALQLIRARPEVALISSVFVMLLEDRVVIYGDCAVNPRPDASQLAQIAISSAESALSLGIEPRVAMLSYSSGDSGKGEEVEKVQQATARVREQWPDLPIEGPIQYDAAVSSEVAHQKLPGSLVGGRATVMVFPDLNAGNNTYKAVQRETGAIAIGPILQGLNKPVNDLSRGCSVEDIVSTIVITSIQAQGAASPGMDARADRSRPQLAAGLHDGDGDQPLRHRGEGDPPGGRREGVPHDDRPQQDGAHPCDAA